MQQEVMIPIFSSRGSNRYFSLCPIRLSHNPQFELGAAGRRRPLFIIVSREEFLVKLWAVILNHLIYVCPRIIPSFLCLVQPWLQNVLLTVFFPLSPAVKSQTENPFIKEKKLS
uniref:Uncharacterized protein n=1 Tax=Sphaerodactylus townsendi TaxID=933632 RepID=A0ACB8G2E5_9SAUR